LEEGMIVSVYLLFPLVPNPQEKGPAELWTPCDKSDPNAVSKSLMELHGDELLLPGLTKVLKLVISEFKLKEYFEKTLQTIKPSVGKKDLEMQENFTKQFGEPQLVHRTPEEVALENELERDKETKKKEEEERKELEFMKKCNDITDEALEQKRKRKQEQSKSKKIAALAYVLFNSESLTQLYYCLINYFQLGNCFSSWFI
jgi:hypothetical protein